MAFGQQRQQARCPPRRLWCRRTRWHRQPPPSRRMEIGRLLWPATAVSAGTRRMPGTTAVPLDICRGDCCDFLSVMAVWMIFVPVALRLCLIPLTTAAGSSSPLISSSTVVANLLAGTAVKRGVRRSCVESNSPVDFASTCGAQRRKITPPPPPTKRPSVSPSFARASTQQQHCSVLPSDPSW